MFLSAACVTDCAASSVARLVKFVSPLEALSKLPQLVLLGWTPAICSSESVFLLQSST